MICLDFCWFDINILLHVSAIRGHNAIKSDNYINAIRGDLVITLKSKLWKIKKKDKMEEISQFYNGNNKTYTNYLHKEWYATLHVTSSLKL